MKKVLFVVPHLSTGGLPQYTLSLIQKIKDEVDVYCIEYSMVSWDFVVQRNKIIDILGNKFFSINSNKNEFFDSFNNINPDIVHLQEVPEYFMSAEIADELYKKNRKYTIVETSHDSSFNINSKKYLPDHFALISEYQRNNFKGLGIPIDLIEADIEYKERQNREEGLKKLGLDPNLKHVLNVGLFTSRKNQAEIFDYARKMIKYPIQFHFVGNQADNFKDYWEPLLKNCPSNVKVWGERSDVDNFYSCMDLFLFTSRGHENDKETSPLVIREAIGYNIPSLIYNLPVYLGMYDKYKTISYLTQDISKNQSIILQKLDILEKEFSFNTLNGPVNFTRINYPNSMYETIQKYGDAAGMWWGTFIHNELENGDVKIEKDDIFVDLGSNIGISSYYALKNGAKKVYCFEPDSNLCSILKSNIKEKISIFQYAVGSINENIELYHWPHNDSNIGDKYSTKSITLNDVFQIVDEPIIDYLKMDIEGFEENIFDNVSKNVMKRIKKMFIEHHNTNSTNDFVKKIEKFGYKVIVEYGNGQNYLYCLNKHLLDYNKDLANISYDDQKNIIYYETNKQLSNITVTVRDIDSHTVIWSAKHTDILGNFSYWIMPLPKDFYDFEKEEDFGGFIFDIYSDENLIFSKSVRIKNIKIKKPITNILNLSEPTFINYNEFFCKKIYDKFLKGNEYNIVVDVGANVGLWSEYIVNVSKVNHVYMVEPNKNALDIINKSFFNVNKFTIKPQAISNTNGMLKFFVNDENSTVSSMMEVHRNSGGGFLDKEYMVQSVTINNFIHENNIDKIDLLKIDIEGAEYALINSMTDEDFKKIENILLEYHLNSQNNINDVYEIILLLKDKGFFCSIDETYGHGGFIFATKNKKNIKIQAIHLLTNTTHDRERKSIEILSKLTNYGIDYKQQINEIYDKLPPKNFCNRPDHISDKNEYIGNGYGTLTGRHYGCYLAHTNAMKNIDENYDYTIIFEADASIDTSYDEFLNIINECCIQSEKDDVYFFGLAKNFSPEIKPINSLFNEANTQNLAHAYLIPNRYKKWFLDRINDVPWDVSDIWLNEVFHRHGEKRYVTTKCYSSQINGESLIDGIVKWEQSDVLNLDYVEIGTSDFDTLVEIMPDDYLGFSIEPIKEYLDKLPIKDKNKKLNVAISNEDTLRKIYFVKEEDILKHNLPEWVKGCNSLTIHQNVKNLLNEIGMIHLLQEREIDVISFETFIKKFKINSIGLLKIDTEGHDFHILRNMLKTNIRPKKIHFEANSLYAEDDILAIVKDLENSGYHLTQRTTNDITMSFIESSYESSKKPILILSTGRRLSYFKKTIMSLFEKNKNISEKIERVWVLDDRSSQKEINEMNSIMTYYFKDKYNMICFNDNDKFYFIEKFKMIKNLINEDDIVFLLEDDWECHDNLRLEHHINKLINSDWTQIAFADPLYIQDTDIIQNCIIDFDYWKNPYPDLFKHPHKWDSDVCFWNKCYINNWTNNPSLIKGEVFFKAQFENGHGFEQNFANELKGNQVFTNECLFRHFGENSLINTL